MVSDVIWVVIYAKPPNAPLRPIFNERTRMGADMMYIRRFGQSKAMAQGDRVVIHFGGPRGSDPYAQYLVQAGYVTETARPLNLQDVQNFRTLLNLTCEGFPHFQTDVRLLPLQGIIRYQLFEPPAGVRPLPRPYPPPKPGQNFIRLTPEHPAYPQIDSWWHQVVPKGHTAKNKAP